MRNAASEGKCYSISAKPKYFYSFVACSDFWTSNFTLWIGVWSWRQTYAEGLRQGDTQTGHSFLLRQMGVR